MLSWIKRKRKKKKKEKPGGISLSCSKGLEERRCFELGKTPGTVCGVPALCAGPGAGWDAQGRVLRHQAWMNPFPSAQLCHGLLNHDPTSYLTSPAEIDLEERRAEGKRNGVTYLPACKYLWGLWTRLISMHHFTCDAFLPYLCKGKINKQKEIQISSFF